jgi:hypothetical protein
MYASHVCYQDPRNGTYRLVMQGEAEVEHEMPEAGDDEEEQRPASSACENLPSLAGGDTPSGGQSVVAKLLISNAAAGSVIGKVH